MSPQHLPTCLPRHSLLLTLPTHTGPPAAARSCSASWRQAPPWWWTVMHTLVRQLGGGGAGHESHWCGAHSPAEQRNLSSSSLSLNPRHRRGADLRASLLPPFPHLDPPRRRLHRRQGQARAGPAVVPGARRRPARPRRRLLPVAQHRGGGGARRVWGGAIREGRLPGAALGGALGVGRVGEQEQRPRSDVCACWRCCL